MERKTNWLAVIVAVLVSSGIGFLWYGFIFHETWMAGNGITMEGEKMFKNGAEATMPSMAMAWNTAALVIYALLINWLLGISNAANWMDGAKVGGAIGLMTLIGVYTGNMFAMNPASLSMTDGSYSLVTFTLMGAILGGWQKK
jgi:Protein of unknown function (DUF1761)